MREDTKISNEHELSMDEILSSIRNIITEDQETRPELRRTFTEDSSTNPSGARMMEDLPKFNQDDFVLPNFKEEELKERTAEDRNMKNKSIFPDEDFEVKRNNERSFNETSDPYYKHERFMREASLNEDRISNALKGIVDSYVQKNLNEAKREEPSPSIEQKYSSGRLTDTINAMIEKTMIMRVEEWLNKNLPEILERAILRELERVVHQMKL